VTFFQGDKQAVVKTKKDGPATTLKSDVAGSPKTAEGGWSMTGDESSVTLTAPGKSAQICHA